MTRVVTIAALLIASAAGNAWAGDPADQKDKRTRALALFEQSEALYKEGKFAEAVAILDEAYALHPEPLLLYNRARAREGMGQLSEAAADYRAYLEQEPEAKDRGAIEVRIESLEKRAAEQQRLEQENLAAKQKIAEMDEKREGAPPPDDEGATVIDGPLPWVFVGVGAAGLGLGLGLGLAASGKHDDALASPVQTEAVELQSSAEDLELGATIAFVAGGLFAAAGTALLIASFATSDEEQTTMSLHIAPSGFRLRGSF